MYEIFKGISLIIMIGCPTGTEPVSKLFPILSLTIAIKEGLLSFYNTLSRDFFHLEVSVTYNSPLDDDESVGCIAHYALTFSRRIDDVLLGGHYHKRMDWRFRIEEGERGES